MVYEVPAWKSSKCSRSNSKCYNHQRSGTDKTDLGGNGSVGALCNLLRLLPVNVSVIAAGDLDQCLIGADWVCVGG